jgi:hypothetical protein
MIWKWSIQLVPPFLFGTELAELNKPHHVYYGNAQTVGKVKVYSLVISQFAIENGPFIVDLPIKDGDFP